jgi:acetolactate synthase-1/2/3 large subunit
LTHNGVVSLFLNSPKTRSQFKRKGFGMNVGEKLAQLLAQSGVKYVFGVPGGQTLPLYEGIRKLDGTIRHILMRDERSAGFAADAHARLTGCIGVCDATVGPGATNLLSPLAEAYCSSIPLLAVISDVPRHWEHRRIRGNASQAMEQLAMFGPVSKWQVTLSEPGSLENVFDQAVRVAISGRPGPVVLAVPDDVAGLPVAPSNILRNRLDGTFPRHRTAPDPEPVPRWRPWPTACRHQWSPASAARASLPKMGCRPSGSPAPWPRRRPTIW